MRFFSSDHLKRHKRTHTGNDIATFVLSSLYETFSFSGEKPYQCEFCEKAFTQNGDLNKHKRVHVGENTYKCTEPDCTDAFRLQMELRDHMRIHYLKEQIISDKIDNVS